MPTVPGVREVGAPPSVAPQPDIRGNIFSGTRSPLIELGNSLERVGGAGGELAVRMQRQQRANAIAERKAAYIEEESALRFEVSRAPSASEAAALYDRRSQELVEQHTTTAQDMGIDQEMEPWLQAQGARTGFSVMTDVAKRMDQETMAIAERDAAAVRERLVGANTETEFSNILGEFEQRLGEVTAAVPGFTPAMAEEEMRKLAEGAAADRGISMLQGAVGDADALASARASFLDHNQHTNLPLDERNELAAKAFSMQMQEEERAWQQFRREEMMRDRARENRYRSTGQDIAARFSAGDPSQWPTTSELFGLLSTGDISRGQFDFYQRALESGGSMPGSFDFGLYAEKAEKAQNGQLTADEAGDAASSGRLGNFEQAQSLMRQLVDLNASAERQGGFMRSAAVEEPANAMSKLITGFARGDPAAQFLGQREDLELGAHADVLYRAKISEVLEAGTPTSEIDTYGIAFETLREVGFAPQAPEPPPGFPGISELSSQQIAEDLLPRMREALAEVPATAFDERDKLKRRLSAIRDQYLPALQRFETRSKAMQSLERMTSGRPGGTP